MPAKSDALDAFALADLLRRQVASWRPLRRSSSVDAELAAPIRDRERFVIERRRLQHQLGAVLETYYPAATKLFSRLDRLITLAYLRRKSDALDAFALADLLRHGLLRASFIPSRPERELRELTRYRQSLIRERTAEINRIQKVLEGANIKLASVASKVTGASGRAILAALLAGESDPATIADLARGRLRAKRDDLEAALTGRVGDHQRFLLRVMLDHLDEVDARITEVGAEIEERLRPFEAQLQALVTIPGIGRRTAETMLAEVGVDMSRFPTAGHLASWAGLCPGNDLSAGKRRSGRTRKGSPWLRSALVESAIVAGRSKTYLGAQFHRIAARRGGKRAAVAVAHSLIVISYHLLSRGVGFQDLGSNYFDQRDRERVRRRLVRRLEALGYAVEVTPAASYPPFARRA